MTLALPTPRRRRRPSLTPMIDVVFLLLVFFMLAARFGATDATPMQMAGAGRYDGPPRLVTLTATGTRLNGRSTPQTDLAEALAPLMQSETDMILIRPEPGASVQDLLDLMTTLRSANLTNLGLLD